jgi:bifunctional non-homologous end joining protein LigD
MQPMLGKPFHRPDWIYEEKYDGWRMLAVKDGPRVRLISRQGVDHTERFRELAGPIYTANARTLILGPGMHVRQGSGEPGFTCSIARVSRRASF